MLNSKNSKLDPKRCDRWLPVCKALEQYPALWYLAYDADEIALKLKYMAIFNRYPYRRWHMDCAYRSYFFKRSFLDRVASEIMDT